MNKRYYSLGLMSGTSLDGIDASIIVSNGENDLEIIDNYYEKYDKSFQFKLKEFINKTISFEYINNNKALYKKLENQLTINHAKVSKEIINKNKDIPIDFIGFHGQTILHNPKKGISIQMGDPNLLSQLLKKKIYFNFRQNDILNGGEGAPLTPIYHYQIFKKIKLEPPVIFLNIGGIANISYIDINEEITSFDVGPGNCLIDQWIDQTINKDFDRDGLIAESGKIDNNILYQAINNNKYLKSNQKSFDIKNFDTSFVHGLNLENGVATLTAYTAYIIAERINKINRNQIPIILCGGGRKNKFLLKNISKYTKYNLINIDNFGIDGDYIESQAFAYLTIRSYLKKNISFPSTTGVKLPVTGGEMFENF